MELFLSPALKEAQQLTYLKRYGNFFSAAHRHLAAASVSPDFVSLDMRNKIS